MCEGKLMSGVLLCLLSLILQAILALVGLVALAGASELSRADYVHQAEPICKANTTANQSILKGTREDVREGRLKQAGRKFGRAARALDRTIQRLEQLPRPVPDESLLGRWFTHLNDETKLLEKVAERLRQETTSNLGRYVLELRHNANVANNVVLTFGFEYCLFQPARYL
jgi:hypothetical protein